MNTERQQRSFLDPQVLARLGALPLLSRKPMLGNVSGRHASPHRGASVEFAEYRKYVPGDDLRRLDWRVLGRTDRYYVKEFEADTNLRMVLVVDTSGSMDFGSVGTTKLQYARQLPQHTVIWPCSKVTLSAWHVSPKTSCKTFPQTKSSPPLYAIRLPREG